jgi:hypothetical protein
MAQYSILCLLAKESGRVNISLMKTIESLLGNEILAAGIKSKLGDLADKISGRVLLFDDQKCVHEKKSSLGLSSLAALNDSVREKLDQQWSSASQSLLAREQSFFLEDEYGLLVFWVPIKEGKDYFGGLMGHGGFLLSQNNQEERRQKKEDLYYLLELKQAKITWDDYLKATSDLKFVESGLLTKQVNDIAALINVLLTEESLRNV